VFDQKAADSTEDPRDELATASVIYFDKHDDLHIQGLKIEG